MVGEAGNFRTHRCAQGSGTSPGITLQHPPVGRATTRAPHMQNPQEHHVLQGNKKRGQPPVSLFAMKQSSSSVHLLAHHVYNRTCYSLRAYMVEKTRHALRSTVPSYATLPYTPSHAAMQNRTFLTPDKLIRKCEKKNHDPAPPEHIAMLVMTDITT